MQAEACCANGCIFTNAANGCSVAEGSGTTASGFASHAEGLNTIANATTAHAEGNSTTASGANSHAEGGSTTASGSGSHSEGAFTTASGPTSHTEGFETAATGFAAHAEGRANTANGEASHTEGRNTTTAASALAAHAEGQNTTANGTASHAEGAGSTTTRFAAHAEGEGTRAEGRASHAEGGPLRDEGGTIIQRTIATGDFSHAEGKGTQANGEGSHAEGITTIASGLASHTQGSNTRASGQHSHAEGLSTLASGFVSHAQGRDTIANAPLSHVEGNNTSANGFTGVHIMGRFGDANELDFSWYLANGTGPANRGLAAKILRDGNVKIDGTVSSPAADYAEMFETINGKPIDVGYFVTLQGEKVRRATAEDDYILGITSATPAVLADSGELRWKNKYKTDKWGRGQYQEVVIPAEKDEKGNIIVPEYTESQPIINPEWNPAEQYVPRQNRPEWIAVGMIGKLLVRDDGTCEVDGYCRPNDQGIASASSKGYRVMKRTDYDQILVLFK
ncbi:hypothetical protein BTR23_16035 [Alkalihalophilus pseudofirmus]|nr:hypothetical protein BTR23_16035 [Alkalihalophilus pseudofirmus]